MAHNSLTPPQAEVYQAIALFQNEHGYSPTIQEIADVFGWKSQSSAQQHVDALIKKGYASRTPGTSRSIRLLKSLQPPLKLDVVAVPLVGRIAAGPPSFALEEADEVLALPRSLFRGIDKLFALRVKGNSMEKAGIFDGDIAVLRSAPDFIDGDIAAVVVDEEATLKRVFRTSGGVRLHPENDAYEDRIIPLRQLTRAFRIAGILVATLRCF